ncbi:hypothetical protein KJ966_14365 [bacterium]|nr:hypothetical protein [bacterium]
MTELRTVRKLNPGIIYGPVQSRRFGKSLGINISGRGKFCSFNCPYCFRGMNQGRPTSSYFKKNLPSSEEVLDSLTRFLESTPTEEIEDWSIAGNAEPTDNPAFPEIIGRLIALRDREFQGVKLTVLTNGMGLIPRLNSSYCDVVEALNLVDRACLKLDSGIDSTWKQLARPFPKIDLAEWLSAANKVEKPVIQTMLVKGRINNSTTAELDALLDCYRQLQVKEINLLTLDKQPLDGRLEPIGNDDLKRVQDLVSGCL